LQQELGNRAKVDKELFEETNKLGIGQGTSIRDMATPSFDDLRHLVPPRVTTMRHPPGQHRRLA
jgi:hypothetical protein